MSDIQEVLDGEPDEIENVEKPEEKQAPNSKPKRKLTDKQLEALARGRQRGVEKLKEKGKITKAVQESNKQLEKIKNEEKLETVEDIKKLNDLNYIRKTNEELISKFNSVYDNISRVENRFNTYLQDREERKKMKDNQVIQKTVRQELPKTVNDMMYKTKLEKEMMNNPFYGRL